MSLTVNTLAPEVPYDIRMWLRSQDARLSLVWMDYLDQFALACEWTENDPRRAEWKPTMIDGRMRHLKPYDIVCFVPKGVGLDWVRQAVPRYMAQSTNDSIRNLSKDIAAHNAKQSDENFRPVFEETMNRVEVLVGNRARMTVYQNSKTTLTRASDTAKLDEAYLREKDADARRAVDE
jgi:hypothetical protein